MFNLYPFFHDIIKYVLIKNASTFCWKILVTQGIGRLHKIIHKAANKN